MHHACCDGQVAPGQTVSHQWKHLEWCSKENPSMKGSKSWHFPIFWDKNQSCGWVGRCMQLFFSLFFWLTPPLWPFWFDLHFMLPLCACKHSLVLQIRFGVWSGGGTFFQLVFEWRVLNRVYVSKPIGFKVVCTCGCLWGSIMCRVCAPRRLWTEVVCGCVDCVLCIVYICTVRN